MIWATARPSGVQHRNDGHGDHAGARDQIELRDEPAEASERQLRRDATVSQGRTMTSGAVAFMHPSHQIQHGKRRIQTRSTKCRSEPVASIRLVNCSGLPAQSLAPGPRK